MGLFTRFTDIINANINSMLDKAEDPEKMIKLIIQEMEETLVEVRSSAAKNIAEKKTILRQIRTTEASIQNWQNKAEVAIQKGREDLAKMALKEKQKCTNYITNMHQISADLLERRACEMPVKSSNPFQSTSQLINPTDFNLSGGCFGTDIIQNCTKWSNMGVHGLSLGPFVAKLRCASFLL